MKKKKLLASSKIKMTSNEITLEVHYKSRTRTMKPIVMTILLLRRKKKMKSYQIRCLHANSSKTEMIINSKLAIRIVLLSWVVHKWT